MAQKVEWPLGFDTNLLLHGLAACLSFVLGGGHFQVRMETGSPVQSLRCEFTNSKPPFEFTVTVNTDFVRVYNIKGTQILLLTISATGQAKADRRSKNCQTMAEVPSHEKCLPRLSGRFHGLWDHFHNYIKV